MSETVDYSGKSLAELSELFHQFATSEDRLQRAKDAEAIKSAFYKTLLKEREKLEDAALEMMDTVEENFKALYASYKKEKAEFNKRQDEQKEDNLKAKQLVIKDLKALLEKDEDVSTTLPAFREIQDRWRGIGIVPIQNFRDLNNTYQLYVEQFYDKLQINRELRDLDFKKNLEIKTGLCQKAEQLAENENVVEAFKELQKLHDSWKDLGPVAKQYREEIWERFKAATALVNKKYQSYFEERKGEQEANLAAKVALCEKLEAIVSQEIADSKLWNSVSKEIEGIQAEWKKIGYATKKENQKVYDRFRASCDKFYERKREFYASFKEDLEANYQKKAALCEEAEQLKLSTEWKKATDQFIALQKKWKEIGAVPRKQSDAIWKRFRAACDEFFDAKEKSFKASRPVRQAKNAAGRVLSEKDKLVARYKTLEQEIATQENNILFFAKGSGNALLDQMRQKIEDAKQELKTLEDKIRSIED
ncbi:MAG: DUF349 domain-containing protein [Bacteroidales bacterium]|nr:DUF349 domain-containing protein [Bacteroidales bacterium]